MKLIICFVVREITSSSEWRERVEHIEENWELCRPEIFKHVVISAALPPCLVNNGSHLCLA